MSDIIPSVVATEEQLKEKQKQEAASLQIWKSLGVQRQFVSFVRVADNKWFSSNLWHITSNGLHCSKIEIGMGSIQAEKPFAIANAKPNQRWLCYFEVTIKEHGGDMYIGMSAADLPNDHHIGNWADAFAINHHGRLYVGGKHTSNIGPFAKNDVIGCGLLLLATGCRRIFFTKNGKLSRSPIAELKFGDVLYPTVSSDSVYDAVEANFGETLEAKRNFRFDLSSISVIDG